MECDVLPKMTDSPGSPQQLAGYSEFVGLGHSDARLRELGNQVSELLGSLKRLESVDVTGAEMALVYARPTSTAESEPAA